MNETQIKHDVAIEACFKFYETLLEPLNDTFGCISIFSGYRSPAVNEMGNENQLSCASMRLITQYELGDLADSVLIPFLIAASLPLIFPA